MLQKSWVTVAIYIVRYFGFMLRTWKRSVAEAQFFFCKVFSLLFLKETHFFLSCYYAEHSKIVQDEMQDARKLFSEGIKLEQCNSTGRFTFMENKMCRSHHRFCWFLKHLVPLSPLA